MAEATFETLEQRGLYRLATHSAQYAAIAEEALNLFDTLAKGGAIADLIPVYNRAKELRKNLDELQEG